MRSRQTRATSPSDHSGRDRLEHGAARRDVRPQSGMTGRPYLNAADEDGRFSAELRFRSGTARSLGLLFSRRGPARAQHPGVTARTGTLTPWLPLTL